MKKNRLVLAPKSRHHIRIRIMDDCVSGLPESEAEKILWCKSTYERLESSPEAVKISEFSHPKKGYLISVWELDGLCYLIQSIKNEFGTYNDTIYLSSDREDCVAIAAFLDRNASTIMRDYRAQILEARDALIKERLAQQAHKELPDA